MAAYRPSCPGTGATRNAAWRFSFLESEPRFMPSPVGPYKPGTGLCQRHGPFEKKRH